MDKDRQIRFLYPPILLIFSLVLGAHLSGVLKLNKVFEFLSSGKNSDIFIALLGASSLVLILGFLLGTVTIFLLRVLFPGNRFNYEILLPESAYVRIQELMLRDGLILKSKEEKHLAAIIFDHGFVVKDVHHWIVRRWNAFFISASSIAAIISSLIIGWCLFILSLSWIIVCLVFILIFAVQCIYSWKDTMKMLDLMTKVDKEKFR